MSTNVVFNGTTYSIPAEGESNWATQVSNYLIAIASGALQKSGGSFTLTAEVDFGATYGLKSAYFKSRGTNPGSTGILRLANAESVVWRNAANNADLALKVNASNLLEYNGNTVLDSAGSGLTGLITNAMVNASAAIALSKLAATTASRALVSDAGGLISASSITATELGYLTGLSEALTTSLSARVLKATYSAKGSLLVATAASTPADFPVGATDGHTLQVDSAQASGMKWAAPASVAIGDSVTSATAGSLLYAGASGVLAQSNSNLYYDYTNKRLLINNTNGGYPLTVTGAASSDIAIEARLGSGSTNGGFHITDNTGATEYGFLLATSSALRVGTSKASSSINFETGGSTRASIDSSGNVNVANLTASRVVVTDASKNLASSAVTATELGYLSGVTSAVQTQLNAKQASSNAVSVSSTVTDGGTTTATTIATGTWTPATWTNLVNIASLTNTGTAYWWRIGKMVYVQCAFDIDPTSASTVTSFDLGGLPVSTGNFTSTLQAMGHTVNNGSIQERAGHVRANSGAQTVKVTFYTGAYVGNDTQYVTFSYQIQ